VNPANDFDLGIVEAISPVSTVNKYRRKARSATYWRVRNAVGLAALCAVLALGGYYHEEIKGGWGRLLDELSAPARVTGPPAGSVKPLAVQQPAERAALPRRLLAISVHDYLFAEPVNPGGSARGVRQAVRALGRNLGFPQDQVYELSDRADESDAPPPIKPVVEQTIERFLATSRPQDRILIAFAGHAVEFDDEPYLVPLEGDLGAKETLISVKWLYDRLATCPARQKALVLDVCRRDPTRTPQKPAAGPMGPKLDALLGNPPPGVQVWSACVAGQFSHEFSAASHGSTLVEGGVFLSALFQAIRDGVPEQTPEAPLPLEQLAEKVGPAVQAFVRAEAKAEQTPRLTGREAAEGAGSDPDQPRPPRFALPERAALFGTAAAPRAEVRAIYREVAVPPLRLQTERQAETRDQVADRLADLIPFRADALKPYADDGRAAAGSPAGLKEHPLRAAVVRAVETLDRQGRLSRVKIGDKEEPVDAPKVMIAGRATEQVKKELTQQQKDGPAMMLVELSEVLDELDRAGPGRGKEPSKRWQAHYDYVLAQVKARMAFVHEYNTALARVKRDELPALDPKRHTGWRLVAQEKLQSASDVRGLAADARKLLDTLVAEHPGTPWEVLAKRDRSTFLGLAWEPADLGGQATGRADD
jgi:hypothetical protein